MDTVSNVFDQIKRDEGLRLTPYKDSVGVLTIGYGCNLEEGITEDEAALLCYNRVARAKQDLNKNIPGFMDLGDIRRGVLINMCYNLGIHRLLGFKRFLAAVAAGDWKAAKAEMMDSLWYRQVGPRAHRLAIQMETGIWQ